jgi:hypothetical protein
MWILLEGGSARVGVWWEGLSSSLNLRGMGGGGAHLILEDFVGLRGKGEFHDGGVTAARGLNERLHTILKERTEKEEARRRGGAANKNTHTRRG